MTTNAPMAPSRAIPGASLLAKVSRATLIRTIIVAVFIAIGTVGMQVLERSMHLTFDKPPMPLRKPLAQMKRHLGVGPRYLADGPDDTLEEDVLQVLGTKDYLLRAYTDATIKDTNRAGSTLDLNVNYYATGNSTPHVPEICWAGSGLEEAQEARKQFVVTGVHRADGTVEDVRMHLISFNVQDSDSGESGGEKRYRNVAYLFEVNGDCVATPKEVISEFWKASNPHAYHTKIEVTIKQACTQEEAEKAISDFIREALPAVEECLPAKEVSGAAEQTAEAGANESNSVNK